MKSGWWTVPLILCMNSWTQTPHIVSPEVLPDGRVTFRFLAPNAEKVELGLAGQRTNIAMQKDKAGVWSVTVGPLPPDIYAYSFATDGVSLIDPSNPLMTPNLLNSESAVEVPGAELPWQSNNVAHGVVHHHFFRSKVAGDERDFYVYTPPGYDSQSQQEYPVLYLLHGFSDDASGWTSVGRANIVLDNLIAKGKAKPMIVVMPLGYGDYSIISGGWEAWHNKERQWRNVSRFPDILLGEVLPQVEKTYKVKRDRESRAIAGLSMGGMESLLTGLNHLDQFAWVGAFSSGGIDNRDFAIEFPDLDSGANKKLKLLWIACGTEDELITVNRKFKNWLKGKGVQFTDIETPGMHDWMTWRRNLAAIVPLLFQGTN